jgi:hypothetical protein
VPEAETVLDIQGIPVDDNVSEAMAEWRNRLMERLDMLANGRRPEGEERTVPWSEGGESERRVSLTLVIVPGKTPGEFFGRFAAGDCHEARSATRGSDCKNTLIGLLEG